MKLLKKSSVILVILLISFIITSCSSSQDLVTFTGERPVRGEVSGTVIETFSDDNPVEDARILRSDSNDVTYSEADGSYRLDGVDNNTEITVAREGYESVSRTIEIEEEGQVHNLNFRLYKEYSEDNDQSEESNDEEDRSEDETNLVETELLFELSWQEGPEDLDAHLIVPDRDNPDQQGYQIYYQDKGGLGSYPFAELDQDILTYENREPETIGIEELAQGRYTYFIKNFSMFEAEAGEETSEISESGAVVKVRENGEWTEYNVPEDQNGMYWHLFEIEVTEAGYQIIEINEITDDINGLDPEAN